jgi:hypothetical protein
MPLLPTWLVQKLRGEFEKNEAMPAHNPSVFASPSNPPTSQQPTQPIDNIAAAPIVPIPPPVVQQPDDSDEIPAEVIEASRRSLLEDELERTKRDNEMQQKYIHDVEIALQESVQSIVNTVSKIANTVVDGVVGLVSSQNKQESAQNTQVTADNIQNTKPDTVNDSCIHTTSVPLVSDSAVIPAVPIQPQQAAPVQPQQNNPECMICFDDECGAVNTVFIPCGHTCCEKCSSAVEICPKCNAPITSRNRFFL